MSAVYPESPLSSPPALPPLPPRWAQAPEPLPDPLDGLGLPPASATPGQAAHRHFGQLPDATCKCPVSCACHEPLTVKPCDDVPRELSEAMAETRAVRDGYQQLLGEFGPSMQSGMSARVSLTVLNRHRVLAGGPPLSRAEAIAEREDITMRYRRERDEAREQLATTQAIARMLQGLAAEILAELDQWELLVEDDKREEWRQRAGLEAGGA